MQSARPHCSSIFTHRSTKINCTVLQVYRGRLRSTGEEVALKVQRPGIGEQICIDMVLLRRLMMAVDATLPRLKLPIQVETLTLQLVPHDSDNILRRYSKSSSRTM